jgi:hypothetical protein
MEFQDRLLSVAHTQTSLAIIMRRIRTPSVGMGEDTADRLLQDLVEDPVEEAMAKFHLKISTAKVADMVHLHLKAMTQKMALLVLPSGDMVPGHSLSRRDNTLLTLRDL